MWQDVVAILVLIFILLLLLTGLTGFWLRVPFVPSNFRAIRALDQIRFSGTEKVCDLGAGSGRVLFYLRKKYPKMTLDGYELAILPYLFGRIWNRLFHYRVDLILHNFFKADLSSYDVCFCYLMPETIEKVVGKLQSYKKPFLLITNTFSSKEIAPQQQIDIPGSSTKIYVYKIHG